MIRLRITLLISLIILGEGIAQKKTLTTKAFAAESALLHIDRNTKLPGEILWYKIYLINQPYLPENLSSVAYVEFLNSQGETLTRQVVKCVMGQGFGQIELPTGLKSGDYTIRAFTKTAIKIGLAEIHSQKVVIQDTHYLTEVLQEVNSDELESSSQVQVSIMLDKEVYSPREMVNVNLTVKGTKSSLNSSVGVTFGNGSSSGKYIKKNVENLSNIEQASQIEQFIYPSTSFLKKIFWDSTLFNTKTKYKTGSDLPLEKILEYYYPSHDFLGDFIDFNSKSDITYKVFEYEQMSSLEEFLNELVPNVKISRSGDKKILRIRNTEDRNNVFVFNKDPLFLVNGCIIRDFELIRQIPLSIVETIDLTWQLSTINNAHIFSLADNGILSLKTRQTTIMENDQNKIDKAFDQPRNFKVLDLPNKVGDDRVPIFANTLFWNPTLKLSGKSKNISFITSDKVGTYTLELIGLTDMGELTKVTRKIVVR